jgi:hypothetical protein
MYQYITRYEALYRSYNLGVPRFGYAIWIYRHSPIRPFFSPKADALTGICQDTTWLAFLAMKLTALIMHHFYSIEGSFLVGKNVSSHLKASLLPREALAHRPFIQYGSKFPAKIKKKYNI